MAKPDLDDGYFKLSYELYAAIAAADFTRGAQIVIWEVFAQIYGWAKLPVATLSPAEIAGRCGLDRHNISRSIKELTDAGVIIKVSEGTYRFIKDYESWKLDESTGQRSYRLAYTNHAPVLVKSYVTKGKSPKPPNQKTQGINPDTTTTVKRYQSRYHDNSKTVSRLIPDGIGIDTVRVSGLIPSASNPPVVSARAIENLENKEKGRGIPPPPISASPDSQSPDPDACPPLPEPDGLWTIQPGSVDPTPADVAATFKLAWKLFPKTNVAFEVWGWQRWHTPAVWQAALREAKRKRPGLDGAAYVEKIASRYTAHGIPASGPSVEPGGNPPEPGRRPVIDPTTIRYRNGKPVP